MALGSCILPTSHLLDGDTQHLGSAHICMNKTLYRRRELSESEDVLGIVGILLWRFVHALLNQQKMVPPISKNCRILGAHT